MKEQELVTIAVALPVKGTFSYRVPEDLEGQIHVGCRVLVPFKNRRVGGFVLGPAEPDQNHVKPISKLLDRQPLFHQNLVPFFLWMAHYYIHPIGPVIQTALPGGLGSGTYKTAALTSKGAKALKLLSPGAEKRMLSWIETHPGGRLPWPSQKLQPLVRKGWIEIEEREHKRTAGPLIRKFVRLKPGVDLSRLIEETRETSRAKGEIDFLGKFQAQGPLTLSTVKGLFPNGSYLVRKWREKGVLECFDGPVYRSPAGEPLFPPSPPVTLSNQQSQALGHIRRRLDERIFAPCLLHGVTGSGKTEVYCRAVEHTVRQGRQAIILVPEISLATYMESVFRSRDKERVAICHSGLSRGERYDEWVRMAKGEVDLVIGARSALFAPLQRLGLIVVDEEHDTAYKQDEGMRYQARDAAVMRARLEQIAVVLGSGTPSVQSYQNAQSGRYRLLAMPRRIENRPMPRVQIVDMKSEEEDRTGGQLLSPILKEAVGKNLESGNQVMLFLNRRGFHRVFLCRHCGQSIRCPNCDVGLVHHFEENRLACHYCGYSSEIHRRCPECRKDKLTFYGFGTERLEQNLRDLFPGASVARMDTDSTRRKGATYRILKRFAGREVDILVGTQMITKGYDFKGVTLVGVIAADMSLAFPDFRGGERTFQILSQVAGRSGRGGRGEVIIQTFSPDHYAIRAAMDHDYGSFFYRECELRAQLGYPPFTHLACVTLSGNSGKRTESAANRMARLLQDIVAGWPKRGREVQVLGPAEAPMAKLKGKHRWQILVKSRPPGLLQHLLVAAGDRSRSEMQRDGIQLVLDVDPYHMV